MNLILVESPTKAQTFNKYLKGDEYHVEATIGHIRDLPQKKIGIDVDNDFRPEYVISPEKEKTIATIKKFAKKADSIILATDADREGEAISYHIAFLLGFVDEKWPESKIHKDKRLKRIVFHEITKSALEEALEHPQEIDIDLVNAQQTRRILDRIVGYKLSPLLWKKIGKRWLSAGRVQTVALRFIVEREKEIKKFESTPFYKGNGIFESVEAKLTAKGTEKYEKKFTLQLFDGEYSYTQTTITKELVPELQKDISSDSFIVSDLDVRSNNRVPPAPYITSTLQQDAARKFGYSSKQTMSLAQNLYEKGLITYHRTDSINLSEKFIPQAHAYIKKTYGDKYISTTQRVFKTSTKKAQEAHEAIRPTDLNEDLANHSGLTNRHKNLYDLIFKRALASQMSDAEIKNMTITIEGKKGYTFKAYQDQVMFEGFLVLYPYEERKITFNKEKGDPIKLDPLTFEEAQTQPPPRYSEASLIRTLEKKGIGRPSTYAPIISTILLRNYVEKQEGRFHPTSLGDAVSDYLSGAFENLFEVEFTSEMEDKLDLVATEKSDMVKILKDFYGPLAKNLAVEEKKEGHIDVQEATDEKCPDSDHPLVIRYSKFGKFYACSDYPNCKYTRNFVEKVNIKCPKCDDGDIIVRFTKKKKRFYGCSNYPKCDFAAWKLNEIESADKAK